jgi:hypothetical protein
MAGTDIFISYKSERREAAEHRAAVLTHHGYSVWFDYQLIKGAEFGMQIERRIREARALVVLWCSLSVGSRWVIEEAGLGHDLGILIPIKIEPCELPMGFRRQDHSDLSSWDGSPRSHLLDPLMEGPGAAHWPPGADQPQGPAGVRGDVAPLRRAVAQGVCAGEAGGQYRGRQGHAAGRDHIPRGGVVERVRYCSCTDTYTEDNRGTQETGGRGIRTGQHRLQV